MAEESPDKKQTHAERVGRKYKPTLFREKEDALDWLGYETANVMKEAQLRIQEATEFVTEYARGGMSAEEFKKRDAAYMFRWGDALKGVADSRGMTDEAIYREMLRIKEGAAGRFTEDESPHERVKGGTGPSR